MCRVRSKDAQKRSVRTSLRLNNLAVTDRPAGKMFYVILYVAVALVVLSLLVVCTFAVYLAHKRRKFAHIPSPPMSR